MCPVHYRIVSDNCGLHTQDVSNIPFLSYLSKTPPDTVSVPRENTEKQKPAFAKPALKQLLNWFCCRHLWRPLKAQAPYAAISSNCSTLTWGLQLVEAYSYVPVCACGGQRSTLGSSCLCAVTPNFLHGSWGSEVRFSCLHCKRFTHRACPSPHRTSILISSLVDSRTPAQLPQLTVTAVSLIPHLSSVSPG